MPILEYYCDNCETVFQANVSHKSVVPDCPVCKDNKLVSKEEEGDEENNIRRER